MRNIKHLVRHSRYGDWDTGSAVRGSKSRRGKRVFLFFKMSISAWGPTQLPIQCVSELFSRVKPPGLDVDYPPRCSAEVILYAATIRSIRVQFSI